MALSPAGQGPERARIIHTGKLAQYSDKKVSGQYLRPNIEPIYHKTQKKAPSELL
jgi:hypothetical protein